VPVNSPESAPTRYIFQDISKRINLLDISIRPELPGKAIVYLDGLDARIYKELLKKLGSEERVQNAIILSGLLSKSRRNRKISEAKLRAARSSFRELVGITFEDFAIFLEGL
jgi:hypothetical protein